MFRLIRRSRSASGMRPAATLGRRIISVLTIVFALGVPQLSSNAQQISDLAPLIKKLADILADVHPESVKHYFIAAFGFEAYGDLALDVAKELIEETASDGEVRNLAGQLQAVYDAAEEAKNAVKAINTNLPPVPDYSHLSRQGSTASEGHCEEGRVLRDKIDRLDEAIAELDKLKNLAQSYLRVMPALQQLSGVLRDYWNYVTELAQAHDAIREKTSLGTMVEQRLYWTFGHRDCSAGDPCAQFLLGNAWDTWRGNEQQIALKIKELKRHREIYDSWYQFWYSGKAKACAGENALTADSLDGELDKIVNEQVATMDAQMAVIDQQFAERWQQVSAQLQTALNRERDDSRRAFLLNLSKTAGLFMNARDAKGLECVSLLIAGDSASNPACTSMVQDTLQRSASNSAQAATSSGARKAEPSNESSIGGGSGWDYKDDDLCDQTGESPTDACRGRTDGGQSK